MEGNQEKIKSYQTAGEMIIAEGTLRGLITFREKNGHVFEAELRSPDGQLIYYQNAELIGKLAEYLDQVRGGEKELDLIKSLAQNQELLSEQLKKFINKQENFLADGDRPLSKMDH
ncbi:MAG: hypothetical protein HZA37_01080 [Parcubacteria group bacterium]|nr:hypothetical protein [Parcubacteria group bacterium]